MSGECYSAKNTHMDLNSTGKDNKILEAAINLKHDSSKSEESDQLSNYQAKEFSVASRSNETKTPADRFKKILSNSSGMSDDAKYAKATKLFNVVESFDSTNSALLKPLKKVRQNSQAIGTDTTGAPLGTINNILAGITKPVALSDFFSLKQTSKTGTDCQEQLHGVEEIKINSKSKHLVSVRSKTKFKAKRSRTVCSSSNLKKVKKPTIKIITDKRYHKGSDSQINKITPLVTKRSKRILVKQNVTNRNAPKDISTARSKATSKNTDLVEIYHNNAVKEAKSSESDMIKKKVDKREYKTGTNIELVPPLSIGENEVQQEQMRGTVSCIYRNYATPTIASRMKQAAKYYMNSFNIKTIPFCLSTSTSPSHNIGINIQQVMSMVKNKQPVGRLSPTLAYNIGLAAGRKEDNLLPFLVSTVSSKTFYTQCPLNKTTYNYQHMQEIAKSIPHETIEETEENEDLNSPETQSIIITGPSGDIRVKNRKQTVWTVSSNEKRCTCVTPKGTDFQQIINKFNGTTSRNKSFNNIPAISYKKNSEKSGEYMGGGEQSIKSSKEFIPLQGKAKKLKEVLKKLHDEFEKMTNTYDGLVKKTEQGKSDAATVKALEDLDKELNSKEEEIVMVMSLYKEVLALKQQVKTLKERTSKENISCKSQISKFNGVNNATADLLNQLLQRVHHFQKHYKRR